MAQGWTKPRGQGPGLPQQLPTSTHILRGQVSGRGALGPLLVALGDLAAPTVDPDPEAWSSQERSGVLPGADLQAGKMAHG